MRVLGYPATLDKLLRNPVCAQRESVVVAMELQSLECACAHHNLFLMETLS